MKWTDTLDIAIALYETHPDVDPQYIRFTDLHSWVIALPEFEDDPERSNEKILEAIQLAWIDEAE
jgi:FeS assembly protein IscX